MHNIGCGKMICTGTSIACCYAVHTLVFVLPLLTLPSLHLYLHICYFLIFVASLVSMLSYVSGCQAAHAACVTDSEVCYKYIYVTVAQLYSAHASVNDMQKTRHGVPQVCNSVCSHLDGTHVSVYS